VAEVWERTVDEGEGRKAWGGKAEFKEMGRSSGDGGRALFSEGEGGSRDFWL
jgi:hypothetical protein